MKKRGFVLCALLAILFLALNVSAGAVCSDGSGASRAQKEIGKYSAKNVNGLGIGVIDSREEAVFNRVSAELLVDAVEIEVSNESSDKKAELLSGSYDVKFENLTASGAKVKIGSSSGELEENELNSLGGLEVYLVDAKEDGGGSAKLVVGKQKIFLRSDDVPAEKVSYGDDSFVVEIWIASDSGATILVWKCLSGDISILEEVSAAPNETSVEQNESVLNESAEVNDSVEESNLSAGAGGDLGGASAEAQGIFGDKRTLWLIVIGVIVFLVLFVLIVFWKVWRKEEENGALGQS